MTADAQYMPPRIVPAPPPACEVSRLREQAAIARSLLDELDRTVPGSRVEGRVAHQLVDTLALLGRSLLEASRAMESLAARSSPGDAPSGVTGGSSDAE